MLIKTADLDKFKKFIGGWAEEVSFRPTAQPGITLAAGFVGAGQAGFQWRGPRGIKGAGSIGVMFALEQAGIEFWDCSNDGYNTAFAAVA